MIALNETVKRAIRGDEHSFYELIEQRKENIYKIAYSYVHNQDNALDIVQEAVYKAYISIGRLKHPEYFNTWLTRIVINCAIDQLKKAKRVVYMDDVHTNDSSSPTSTEEIMDLRDALKKLDVKYKSVIILKYFKGMTLKEISDILDLPLSTVKTHVYRGLEKLKIDLEEVEEVE